ncbi:hypothetical protein PLIIFM63780_006697 [Purpureocillium lilacinum]|nr:hypothetical protein PLIIFM63780_006697 [Purpureocillium lilacinum]
MTSPTALALLASTPVDAPIPPQSLTTALSSPPFITTIPGALNVRDLGAYAPLRGLLRPRTVFRSGTLDFLPAESRPLLRSQLGVSRVVDFRRRDEVKVPLLLEGGDGVQGVTLVSCPYMDGREQPRQMGPGDFVAKEGEELSTGYEVMYDVILRGYTTGYRTVFEALRTAGEGDAVLFHCTGGKDRTGVMAALILDLLGAPIDVIADEYALTRIGTEPWREKLLPVALRSFGVQASTAAPDPRAVSGDGETKDQEAAGGEVTVDIETPGMREMLGTYAAVMKRFVERLRGEYGGAEGYMKNHLGFSDTDVAQIRANLRPSN